MLPSLHTDNSSIDVHLLPFPVAIVSVHKAHVHLVGVPILEVLDDFKKQPEGFFSLTGNSHELSLVSSSSDLVSRFQLFATLARIDLDWRLFQVEMCPEELGVEGLGKVQQISSLLASRGVSMYYTCSDENDFFLCRSSDFETVCSALSSQGWLKEGSLYDESTLESVPHLDLDGPVKIVDLDMVDDDGSASCSSDAWLDAKSSFVNTPREADSLDISLVDIPPASPLPTPPLSQPVHTSAGIKSSLGLVGTQFHLSSPAIKSFIQRWSLGDADDHPFFSIVGDSSLASGSSTGCEKQIKVAVFGNALALEKFVPGSVVEEDLEEAMASLPFALEVKHARHHSVPPSLFASFSQALDGRPASAGGRPGLVHRHSHPPPSSTFVDHWLQALDDSLTRLEEDTAGGRDESGLTRVWGSIEINLLGTDGLHRPGIIHSYTDQLKKEGIDMMSFSVGNGLNILVPQAKLAKARRILNDGH